MGEAVEFVDLRAAFPAVGIVVCTTPAGAPVGSKVGSTGAGVEGADEGGADTIMMEVGAGVLPIEGAGTSLAAGASEGDAGVEVRRERTGVLLGFVVSGATVGAGVTDAGSSDSVGGAVVATGAVVVADGVGFSVGTGVASRIGDGVSSPHRKSPAGDGGADSTDRVGVSSSGMSSSKL